MLRFLPIQTCTNPTHAPIIRRPIKFELEAYTGPVQPAAPAFAAFMTGATFYMPAGPRVAALAGTIGVGAVGITYLGYSVLGIPYGSKGFMFF
jgi:hypothetical protein